MLRDDYLMRFIQTFMAGLVAAKRAVGNDAFGPARLSLDALALDYLGINLEKVATQSLVVLTVGRPPYEIAMAADILTEYALLESAQGIQSSAMQVRALRLYEHALTQDSAQLRHSERRVRLRALVHETSEHADLDVQTRRFTLLERLDLFGQAEDLLFALAETGWADARVYGRSFFERLLTYDEERLVAGGLPRAECLQGLSDLMAMGDGPREGSGTSR